MSPRPGDPFRPGQAGGSSGEAIAMVAGLGHILLTLGLVLLFITLGKLIPARSKPATEPTPAAAID